jgi:micrococcal nuclease
MDRIYPVAQVVRVIDADTLVLDVDLGFGVWQRYQSFRLLGCNGREHSDVGGLEATANLAAMLPAGTFVSLTSIKPDKYGGRYDARITLPDGRDLTQVLVTEGWVAVWNGKGLKPVPPWPRQPLAT